MRVHLNSERPWWGQLSPPAHNGLLSQKTGTFKDQFFQALSQVNQMQREADHLAGRMAAGEVDDLSQVMLATEKAKLSMLMTLRIRNQALDAYKEIMRMQV